MTTPLHATPAPDRNAADDADADGQDDGDLVLRLPARPGYGKVRAAARHARLVGDSKVTVVKVPAKLVRLAEAALDRGTLLDAVDALLPAQQQRPTGGAKRVLTVRALFLGLLLLALTEQPMILRDAVALLNDLHPSTKHRLGIPQRHINLTGGVNSGATGGVTERMVSRLFNQIARALDPSPHSPHHHAARAAQHDAVRDAHPGPANRALRREMHRAIEAAHAEQLLERLTRLQYVMDRGLDATLPDGPDDIHSGSYSLDSSELPSWAHQHHSNPRRPEMISDPDARWNGKGDGWFGYWLHGIVRVGEVGGPRVPCLVERLSVTAANADVRVAALDQLERMVADHERADTAADRPHRPRRTILADAAYTSEVNAAPDFLWPVFALGFDTTHRLTKYQLGLARHPLSNGAIVIDGQPHSPRTPEHLRHITPPPIGATRDDIEGYQRMIAQREPFALHPVGGRRDDGCWDFGCRAMSLLGQLRCSHKPASMAKPPTAKRLTTDPAVFAPRQLPKICGQQKSRVHMTELPYWQPLPYGSREWYDSWNRRNRIEGIFGNVKSDASQNLTRGCIRVMGLAKVSLMAMFVVMAANLRLAQTHELNLASDAALANGRQIIRRQPRYHTRLKQQMRERIAAHQQQAQAQDAAAGHVDLHAVGDDPPPPE